MLPGYTEGGLRPIPTLLALRACCLVALSTSVALSIDYISPEPSFCGLDSGCGAVRESGLGYLQLPGVGLFPFLPVLGVLAFSLLFTFTLIRRRDLRSKLAEPTAYGIGVGGLGLLLVQAISIGRFCALCVVVDIASVLCAALAFALRKSGWQSEAEAENEPTLVDADALRSEGHRVKGVWRDDSRIYSPPNPLVRPADREPVKLRTSGWVALFFLSVLIPVLYPTLVKASEVPSEITELYEPGKINVVEFFDYQCPHCQALAPRLEEALEPYRDRVHFVRQHVPLPGHDLGRRASRSTLCAAEQGQGEALARAIFGLETLDRERLDRAVGSLDLDQSTFEACLASQRPDQQLDAMTRRIKDAGFVGLPTTYVGGIRILGAESVEVYRDALRRVEEGKDRGGLDPWLFWVAAACIVAAVAIASLDLPKARVSQVPPAT